MMTSVPFLELAERKRCGCARFFSFDRCGQSENNLKLYWDNWDKWDICDNLLKAQKS